MYEYVASGIAQKIQIQKINILRIAMLCETDEHKWNYKTSQRSIFQQFCGGECGVVDGKFLLISLVSKLKTQIHTISFGISLRLTPS